ncbi:uncharacterized protein EI97DRAFT_457596 [Westerdykella ornata]|uniref:Integral membrane protein n=1 Tax=Westerdykella ornata TaxID=318751 RepID=A0A6A6JRN2_WESOR|nr:uncharacterized protein EI97DRAFT_457596 [Westerdykella ornata]KAF2277599.1 hypothetical protein EI97DRAFT_457596 [Westerdykella ornata]
MSPSDKPLHLHLHLRLVRPLARAYLLGLLSTSGPRLARVLLALAKGQLCYRSACSQVAEILHHAIQPYRFPAFCGTLVGGACLLQIPIGALLTLLLRLVPRRCPDPHAPLRLTRFIAALVSASVSFTMLNRIPASAQLRLQSEKNREASLRSGHPGGAEPSPFNDPPKLRSLDVDDAALKAGSLSRLHLAGRTMDLTLFAVTRALDIAISSAWARLPARTSSKLRVVPNNAPTWLFCFSAASIMHAWFYSPLQLPRTYNKWISAAAELDQRLLTALRHARYGNWEYGKDTGMAPLLGSMCRDYGLPEIWGDPAHTVPIPCELVHMGQGKSCEKHALWRFWRGWAFAAKMYGPLQLIVLLRKAIKERKPPGRLRLRLQLPVILGAFADMARSSAFLGAFISLFYYGVCLSRTRLGPKLFSSKTVTPQMWDSGLCILAGCLLCGSSILVEHAKKRIEILFFVLPRAAAVWFPRRYLPKNRWKEHVAFALSAALVLTTAQEDPARVRGVFGKLLPRILKTD